MGLALYPHAQWDALVKLWESLYPLAGLDEKRRTVLSSLEASIPELVQLLVNFRPKALRGKSLKEVMPLAERHPSSLSAYFQAWAASPEKMRTSPPSLVFAAIGQAKISGKISPEAESSLLAGLLSYWAMRSALDTSAICATQPRGRLAPPAAFIPTVTIQ
jgi:hypothetical protein